MYTMVMMAALTTGIDMPDRGGRRGGGCCGCYGGGMGMGMGMGMGYGGGMGMGMGYGGCMGMGMGMGGMGMRGYGYGGGGMRSGYGYGGYTLGSIAPMMGSYAYSGTPYTSGWGNSLGAAGGMLNQGTNQSFYFGANSANEATIVVHLPQGASLTIDGEQTQQQSATRTFTSPPLESGKVYTYTLKAEIKRDGHTIRDSKTIDVQAGRRSEVTMKLENANRDEEVRTPASRSSPRRSVNR